MRLACDYIRNLRVIRREAASGDPNAQGMVNLLNTLRQRQMNPLPDYSVLPTEREVTLELSQPAPEYTPREQPPEGQGQKRTGEENLDGG